MEYHNFFLRNQPRSADRDPEEMRCDATENLMRRELAATAVGRLNQDPVDDPRRVS